MCTLTRDQQEESNNCAPLSHSMDTSAQVPPWKFHRLAPAEANRKNQLEIRRSRFWRLQECGSSSLIFLITLASSVRPSSWATFCSSFVHSRKNFSCTLLLLRGPSIQFVTLRINPCSNFSFVFGFWSGCLEDPTLPPFPEALLFFSACQCSQLRRTSSSLISASCWRTWASSLSVASTLKPAVSSTKAAAS